MLKGLSIPYDELRDPTLNLHYIVMN